MKSGHARVSIYGQIVDPPTRQLTNAGCKKAFRKTASGAKAERVHDRKTYVSLDAGDAAMVAPFDRLTRSIERKVHFRSLTDTWAENTTAISVYPWATRQLGRV
jgi:hypothetical protein